MRLTKKTIKKNTKMSNNISGLSGLIPGRAIIVTAFEENWNNLSLRDFYNIVISTERNDNLQDPDFTLVKERTSYKNYILDVANILVPSNTIYITQLHLISELKKIKKMPEIHNINYLMTAGAISNQPILINSLNIGLSVSDPAVHLAKILGATTIFSTKPDVAEATYVTYSDVEVFCTEKDPLASYLPKNLISKKRETALNIYF